MHAEGFFAQAFVYLLAAVVAVPLARRLGLGSVLGYLIAGVAIGPFGLGLVGQEGQDVMHFAEFGVVMMLFLVGLEVEPTLLWRLRAPILGLGGLQVAVTALAVGGIALACGLTWQAGLAVGLTLAMSSTAIVLQTLNEKGLMRTAAGQSSFAVLLFQDLAVIPILAVFPILAVGVVRGTGAADQAHRATWSGARTVVSCVSATPHRWTCPRGLRPARRTIGEAPRHAAVVRRRSAPIGSPHRHQARRRSTSGAHRSTPPPVSIARSGSDCHHGSRPGASIGRRSA
jgi:predicted Kef-type K+ transport protein